MLEFGLARIANLGYLFNDRHRVNVLHEEREVPLPLGPMRIRIGFNEILGMYSHLNRRVSDGIKDDD